MATTPVFVPLLPAEILSSIAGYVVGGEGFTGLGLKAVAAMSLVSRAWRIAALSQFACVPQKKRKAKRGAGMPSLPAGSAVH